MADQKEALNPDTKNPFKSRADAVKRLLRYHLYDKPNIPEEKLDEGEQDSFINPVFVLSNPYLLCFQKLIASLKSWLKISSSRNSSSWTGFERASLKRAW